MATTTRKTPCAACGKEKSTVRCEGCSQTFCYNHLGDHRQEISQQLDEVEVIRDLFRQTLTEQKLDPKKHALIREIDKWERESIRKIQRTAEEARQLLLIHTTEHITKIEVKLNKLTDQLQESRQENDFFETDLQQWKEQLTRLKEDLIKPLNIKLRPGSTPFVTKIYVDLSAQTRVPNIAVNAKWIQKGVTIAGGNAEGDGLNQFNSPYGLYVDDDETVYIADYSNHRIVAWKSGATRGQVVAGGNGHGSRSDQLNNPIGVIIDKESDSLIISDYGNKRIIRWPRRNGRSGQTIISDINCYGLAMDNNGYLYVSDYSKHEVRRWKMGDTRGRLVAGGNRLGNRLNQLNVPTYIFVDQDHSVFVSDNNNHRVMKWMKGAKEGIVVAGGQCAGNGLTQLHYSSGIVIDQLGSVYVADYGNDRVMCWPLGAIQGTVVVGGNEETNQFNGFSGLRFDRQGNLYVAYLSNHRVQKFQLDPSSNS